MKEDLYQCQECGEICDCHWECSSCGSDCMEEYTE